MRDWRVEKRMLGVAAYMRRTRREGRSRGPEGMQAKLEMRRVLGLWHMLAYDVGLGAINGKVRDYMSFFVVVVAAILSRPKGQNNMVT